MSARVANPFTLNEMRRLREAVAAKSFRPDPEARLQVCRNLYGRASADDSRSFAAKELAQQRERATERWGFDFLREAPRSHGPGADRYKWTRVRIGTVPAAYRMPRMAPLTASTAATTATPLVQAALETARTTVPVAATPGAAEASPPSTTTTTTSLLSPDLASPPSECASAPSAPPSVRQTTINEFMVCRKRTLPRKTDGATTPAAKRARVESGPTKS